MATTEPTQTTDVQDAIRDERRLLAESVVQLRDELREAADIGTRLRAALPRIVVVSAIAGFVAGGGLGATMRLLARRLDGDAVEAELGRFALLRRRRR
jgi:hypothetical protein